MTKIRPVLLWLLIASPFFGFGHPPKSPKPAYLTNEVRTDKQAVFTAHLLTDQVEPEKKYMYDRVLTINVYDQKSQERWTRTLKASELK